MFLNLERTIMKKNKEEFDYDAAVAELESIAEIGRAHV